MRDLKALSGRKQYCDTFEDACERVRESFPTATRQGSVGAWSWHVGGKMVAEAWLHATKPGWWIRIGRV